MRKHIEHTLRRSLNLFSILRLTGVGMVIFGLSLMLIGQTQAHSGSAPAQRKLPIFGESTWGKWHKEDIGTRFPTMISSFSVGETIVVQRDTSIRVDSIDRNWSPAGPWQTQPTQPGGQDDARGKEIILIRFTITNLSAIPLNYSDAYFSLIRSDGREQRVAALAELTSEQYGSFGQTTPWLMPGVSAHSFVPFLVNPGERALSFVFYRFDLQWTQSGAPQGKSVQTPPNVVGIARVVVNLTNPQASAQASQPRIVMPNGTYVVSASDVYSPSPQ